MQRENWSVLLFTCLLCLPLAAQEAPQQIDQDQRIDAIIRDSHGLLRHLRYQDQLENAERLGVDHPTAQRVADAYLRSKATAFSIPDAWLTLDKFDQGGMTDAPSKVQSAEMKGLGNTYSVAYVQTKFGLPVWQEGIALTIAGTKNPYVVSVSSSLDPAIDVKKPEGELQFPTGRPTPAELARVLGIQPDQLRINLSRLIIYRYRKGERTLAQPPKDDPMASKSQIVIPQFPLPLVPNDIFEHAYRVVNDVGFQFPVEKLGNVNWRAFIDLKSGSVLYLRANVSFARGRVFFSDPISIGGNGALTPLSPVSDLNPLRSSLLPLDGLTLAVGGVQSLIGNDFVKIEDINLPTAAPPTTFTPFDFDYSVDNDHFAAVCAYYHCDATFRLVQSFGINVKVLFSGTSFPVPVDHRALGDVWNAWTHENTSGNGVASFLFGRAATGSAIGIATDKRVVLHEFCHAILWNSTHAAVVGFGEGCGDSLAAIMCAPDSKAPDPNMTFPWTIPVRRHDRLVSDGWGWGGAHDIPSLYYDREQILSTSLYRLYRAIGGDDPCLSTKVLGARTASNLLVRGLGLLNPYTPTTGPECLESTMIAADSGTAVLDGVPGGAIHKVVRWTFAKQGLHRPSSIPTTMEGGPPPVDVYINDGRDGDYLPYHTDWAKADDIWNRLAPDGGSDHQPPIRFQTNYLYVRTKNRGTETANDVSVRMYNRVPATAAVWPSGLQAVTTTVLPAPGDPSVNIAPGAQSIFGPFVWTPAAVEDLLIASVSAVGDPSNIDPLSPLPVNLGPTPLGRLVPFDNNIAARRVETTMPIVRSAVNGRWRATWFNRLRPMRRRHLKSRGRNFSESCNAKFISPSASKS